MMRFIQLSLVSLACLVFLAGCLSGSSPEDQTPGGIDRGGLTIGTVSGFGSVIVNGIRFDTSESTILDEDESIEEDYLEVGHRVVVSGSFNAELGTGEAMSIVLMSQLVGPVQSIDLDTQILSILGHEVQILDETLFSDGLLLESISEGQVLRVFGQDANGIIQASRIEAVNQTENLLRGRIRSVDEAGQRLLIGDQWVDYADAEFENISADDIREGLVVKVQAVSIVDEILIAETIKNETKERRREEGAPVVLEGIVEVAQGMSTLVVAGLTVTLNEQTKLSGDGKNRALTEGLWIEVVGSFQNDETILAETLKIKTRGRQKIEGEVSELDLDNHRLTIEDTEITVTSDTQFIDQSNRGNRRFGLVDIVSGDYLEVKGYVSNETGFTATQVKRRDSSKQR